MTNQRTNIRIYKNKWDILTQTTTQVICIIALSILLTICIIYLCEISTGNYKSKQMIGSENVEDALCPSISNNQDLFFR
jgi:ABC-type multidrug transport system permease subunit